MRLLLGLLVCVVLLVPAGAGAQMYGSVSPAGVLNPGGLLTVDTVTGVGTLVGDAVTPGGLSGLAFDSTGALYGSTRVGGGIPGGNLVLIDPNTGSSVLVGAIQDGAANDVGIADLAFQPGTDVLFAIAANDGPCVLCLFTIDTTTAVATLVGDPGLTNGGLAFDPNGTLYLATSFSPVLAKLDPNDGSVISSISLGLPLDGLGISPAGAFFGTGPAQSDDIVSIDPVTGGTTIVGQTGAGSTTDLDFRPAPPPPLPVPLLPDFAVRVGLGLALLGLISRLRIR
jgi:hypothetical protein